MLPKIISILIELVAVGFFIWEFKDPTPFVGPELF